MPGGSMASDEIDKPFEIDSKSMQKPGISIEEIEDGSTTFNQVYYLGSMQIEAPKNEIEILNLMKILNENSAAPKSPMEIIMSVPSSAQGAVRLLEAETQNEISEFRIEKLAFCARGRMDGPEKACFAFTYSQGQPPSLNFQCHVFRCAIPEAVSSNFFSNFVVTFRMLCHVSHFVSHAQFLSRKINIVFQKSEIHLAKS